MNTTVVTLDKLPYGVDAKIIEVAESSYACTLLTMGILPHVKISVLRSSPFGQSLYVKVGGTYVAMRKREGQSITVRPIKESTEDE